MATLNDILYNLSIINPDNTSMGAKKLHHKKNENYHMPILLLDLHYYCRYDITIEH